MQSPDPTCKMCVHLHAAMLSQLLFCPLYHVYILRQTHSRCTNCAPNTRVLTSQGSWIVIRESVDSLCRDGADVQYMQYLSKSRITLPQTR